MGEKKTIPSQLNDETMRLIREQAEKKIAPSEDTTPILSEDALKEVLKNVEKRGKVWKKPKKKK